MFLSGLKYLRRLERQVKFAKNRCCKIKPVAVLVEILRASRWSRFYHKHMYNCHETEVEIHQGTANQIVHAIIWHVKRCIILFIYVIILYFLFVFTKGILLF